jgi:hypothetical protein
MSWAVPEVRKHLIDGLGEAVSFGADGAHIVYNRGVPMVLYEPAFLEMFQKKHGEDPRKVDEETDPRVRQAWGEVVTTFMRETRTMLNEEQRRRGDGKHLALSAMIFGNEYDNMFYGIDVRRWVTEGLIDEIFPYRWDIGAKKAVDDLKFYREVCLSKGVPVRLSFAPSPKFPALDTSFPWSTIEEAISAYEQGMPGITFFDATGNAGETFFNASANASDINKWVAFSRFGHVDELRLRLPQQKASVRVAPLRFHRLGRNIMDSRFGPLGGG